jgi:transposase
MLIVKIRNIGGIYWLDIGGWKKAHIAKTVSYHHSTVTSIIKRIKETGSPIPRKSTGRPKIITKRRERHMEKVVRDTPFMSFDQVIDAKGGYTRY